jgi:hypothetical protein
MRIERHGMLETALCLWSITLDGQASRFVRPDENSRDLADFAYQSVLSVVHPHTFGRCHGVNCRGFVRICIKLVRRKAIEKALGGRGTVLI